MKPKRKHKKKRKKPIRQPPNVPMAEHTFDKKYVDWYTKGTYEGEIEFPYGNVGKKPIQGPPNLQQIWGAQGETDNLGQDWNRPSPQTILYEDEKQFLKSEVLRDFYFKEKLGSGAYGDVMKVSAQWRPTQFDEWPTKNGQPVYRDFAMKVIRHVIDVTPDTNSFEEKFWESLEEGLNEVQILRYLRHENIVNIKDTIGIPDQKTGFPYAVICIFMECCDGSLQKILYEGRPKRTKEPRMAPEHLTKHWFRHVLLGLEYLHGMGVAHRDLYPTNILYVYRERGIKLKDATHEQKVLHSIFKICDFGLSRTQEFYKKNRLIDLEDDDQTFQNVCLLDLKLIVETVKDEIVPFLIRGYTKCANGESDLRDFCQTGERKKGYRNEWEQLSPEFRRFFVKFETPDLLKNMTALDILTDPWVDTDGQIRKKIRQKGKKPEFPSRDVKKIRRL